VGVVEPLPASRKPYTAPRPIEEGDAVAGFTCGKPPLDDFLKQRALKNEGKASRTYVVCSTFGEDAGAVVAYYSLAAGAVSHEEVPGWARRNMPNPVPVIVLARLAVDCDHQGKGRGVGKALLKEAIKRSLEASRTIGARALVVHAIDDEAVSYYAQFGFQRFPTDSRTLFLPIETLRKSL
jgi:ribosomal protein S18 acetylase RimI-like enzyme